MHIEINKTIYYLDIVVEGEYTISITYYKRNILGIKKLVAKIIYDLGYKISPLNFGHEALKLIKTRAKEDLHMCYLQKSILDFPRNNPLKL